MFPLDIDDYEKIEDRIQMQVNVFGEEDKVYPLYISKKILGFYFCLRFRRHWYTKPLDFKFRF